MLYRHPDLDVKLTSDRHKAEARALLKCKQARRKPAKITVTLDSVTSDRGDMSNPLHGRSRTASVDNAAAGGENCQGGSGPGHC